MSDLIRRTIYLSQGRYAFSHIELWEMCEHFAMNNADRDVTGVLLRIGNYFIQVLEGSTRAVDELISKIEQDERHGNFTILSRQLDRKRAFGQWSMNLLDLESTYYVNLHETTALRKKVADILNCSTDTKANIMSLIVNLTNHVRASARQSVL